MDEYKIYINNGV